MMEQEGLVSKGTLSRASVHRFLKCIALSKRVVGNVNTIERRSFVAKHPGDIWQGDVLHGPKIQTAEGFEKTYLVSLMDDASRLITHSAFCMGETALDIEGVLKSALLKRGVPDKLIIDNGAAYRSGSLQKICAHLEIRLVYCRPYEPEGKGKLERFHRTFREQFLNELDMTKVRDLGDLNARLWAWLESIYHTRVHASLKGKSPIERWRDELIQVRPLSPFFSNKIDDIFYHRCERLVRKDGTIHWNARAFEVDHSLVGEKVILVFNPHLMQAIGIENNEGASLGDVFEQDLNANLNRKRQRPHAELSSGETQQEYGVEKAYDAYVDKLSLNKKVITEEG
jgi:transposase InsO family protein